MLDTESPAFGVLLREHRLGAGLTQATLAELTGLSARGIQALERGTSRPYRETARRLAEALALSPEQRRRFEVAAARPRPRSGSGAVARPPAATVDHNLPAQLTSFVGRERELAEL